MSKNKRVKANDQEPEKGMQTIIVNEDTQSDIRFLLEGISNLQIRLKIIYKTYASACGQSGNYLLDKDLKTLVLVEKKDKK